MAPPLADSGSSTLGFGGSASSYRLAGRADDGAGFAWGDSAPAGRAGVDKRGAQGGGGVLQRGGRSYQEQHELGALALSNAPPREFDRIRSGMPGVKQQQREKQQQHGHTEQEMQLQRLLLEDDTLDESDAGEGRGQPAPADLPPADERMLLLSDDGSLVEFCNKLGTL